jgi:hypothetical protein
MINVIVKSNSDLEDVEEAIKQNEQIQGILVGR